MTDTRPSSPLPGALRVFARPLAAGYSRIIGSRNAAFDAGRGVVEIDRPVISVGNLSVGGTGKTPMVAWVVRTLVEAGHHPAIAMRGYASGAGESDEALEYRESFDGVPVVAQPDRLAGLLALFATEQGEKCDCVVLDDGFQHRRISRQLDIVLVDATCNPFSDRLLPSGWLREPVASLARAGVVVLTHSESAPASELAGIKREIARIKTALKIAVSRHVWKSLTVVVADGQRSEPVAWLRGKRVVAACGIGNPGPFVKSVNEAAGNPAIEFVRPDHDPFVPRTLQQLVDLAKARAVDAIVVTGKDWAKLKRVRREAWPCPVVRAHLEIAFDEGAEALKRAVLDTADAALPAREQ
ncbi:MAG: tetraacyldisaccharide 4'-kinase [Phycisphaeraceae bacterium]|nr:tetraacyldisaccharide 4'-kinase [Phycisphaeraceae bacterium]